jgi:hypothetical protein
MREEKNGTQELHNYLSCTWLLLVLQNCSTQMLNSLQWYRYYLYLCSAVQKEHPILLLLSCVTVILICDGQKLLLIWLFHVLKSQKCKWQNKCIGGPRILPRGMPHKKIDERFGKFRSDGRMGFMENYNAPCMRISQGGIDCSGFVVVSCRWPVKGEVAINLAMLRHTGASQSSRRASSLASRCPDQPIFFSS